MRIGSRTYECNYGLFRRHSTRQRSALSVQFCNFGANIACKRIIDILGPRLPTHTWRERHMYEESKMASSTGQKTRELYYEKQVFGLF